MPEQAPDSSQPAAPASDNPQPSSGWNLDFSYQSLPEILFERVDPEPVPAPRLLFLNHELARSLGLDPEALDSGEGLEILAGNRLPPESRPIAQAYAGHQYGHFTALGDGRAVMLGEQLTPEGRRFDLQYKGSGRTPFSRRGDGRAALGPMLREYILSEAMAALGVPTTRTLSVVATGQSVRRQTLQPGAVMVRVADSHIRVGTFEWAAAMRQPDTLESLVNHTLVRHGDHPGRHGDPPALRLLDIACGRMAALVAQWQGIGFIHGVLNTDNVALSGETIDYGPCAFMDRYDPATVFSSIDRDGRYAYGNQPTIMHWNLARLAEALLQGIDADEKTAIAKAEEVLASFPQRFEDEWLGVMRAKLGLETKDAGDRELVDQWLALTQDAEADFTNSFRILADLAHEQGPTGTRNPDWPGTEQLLNHPDLLPWLRRWRQRLGRDSLSDNTAATTMNRVNPAVIPRNHQVEHALQAAEQNEDLGPMRLLLRVLSDPRRTDHHEFRSPPTPEEVVHQTFCGT